MQQEKPPGVRIYRNGLAKRQAAVRDLGLIE
jgi:hypothetical protein